MTQDMERVKRFYERQNEWAGVYSGEVTDAHRKNAAAILRLAGGRLGRLLDLGAGGGQNAAAAADLGYEVTAVEIVPSCLKNARKLAARAYKGGLEVVEGDFYEVEFPEPFDTVTYWDGFGIGPDEDQRMLLARIASWLRPTGFGLIEVYTPWYWERAAGREMRFGNTVRRYGFDREGSRMLDRWWPEGREAEAVSQSLRCYSLDELEALLRGIGLALDAFEPRGSYDFESGRYFESAPIAEAMQYLAKLVPETSRPGRTGG